MQAAKARGVRLRLQHSFLYINVCQGPVGCVAARSIEVCNTLSHEGFANVNTEKNVLSSLLYTFLNSTPGLNGNEALCCSVLMGMKPAASDWSMISRIVTR